MGHDHRPGIGANSSTPTPTTMSGPGAGKRALTQPELAPTAGVAAQPKPADSARPSGRGQLGYLLATPAPPLGDPVIPYLLSLSLPAMLDEVADAVACGYALQLEPRLAVAPPLLTAVLQATELARTRPITPYHPALQRAGDAFDHVPREIQLQILAWMLARGGVTIEATRLVEGTLALRDGGGAPEEEEADDDEDTGDVEGNDDGPTLGERRDASIAAVQSVGSGMPAPILPDKWRKPKGQPGGFYIGTDAHDRIANYYADVHRGDVIARNYTSLSAILRLYRGMGQKNDPNALNDAEKNLKPDILNLSKRRIFEIKPATAQAAAAAQVLVYVRALAKAGIDVDLGPTDDPGATGALPAPAGVFQFMSPAPGVITYGYNRAKLVPVPVPFAQRAKSPSKARWRWELKPIKLTPAQKQAVATTTLGGALLLIAMILLAPVGA